MFMLLMEWPNKYFRNLFTHMTIAEFFMMRPHGPNCCMGLGAFRLLVLLQIEQNRLNKFTR